LLSYAKFPGALKENLWGYTHGRPFAITPVGTLEGVIVVKKILKSGLLMALGGLFATNVNAAQGEQDIAAKVQALTKLSDEYAETGKGDELSVAIQKLSVLREKWEKAGSPDINSPNINPQDVSAQMSAWRTLIENSVAPAMVSDEMDSETVKKPGYAGEYNGSTLPKWQVVITFDDGPHPTLTPLVHAIVKQLNIPAAFFEIGQNIKAHPALTQGLASEGYIIGDHTWDHPQLTSLKDPQVSKEINDTQKEIQTVLGGSSSYNLYFHTFFAKFFQMPETVYDPEFFRSPYGARSVRTMKLISNTVVGEADPIQNGNKTPEIDKLYHILWNVDSLDWQDKDPASIEKRVFAQLATYGNHGVILFHDIHPQTIKAIQSILPRLAREGYKFVSLYDMVTEAEQAKPNF
jgi:peptidoglycan/xylan/chitin deacetylase (PgdA/CDA1 family)